MLYAIVVYNLNEEKQFEKRYEIIFRDISKALSYAYKKTSDAPCFQYYGIKRMSEAAALAEGLEDLIES